MDVKHLRGNTLLLAVVMLLAPPRAEGRTPTPTDGPSPTPTAYVSPTSTGTAPPGPPYASVSPNPARSGQTVTLIGSISNGGGGLHWSQIDGDVAIDIGDADAAMTSFVAPTVEAATLVTLRLERTNVFLFTDTLIKIVPADTILMSVGNASGEPGGSGTVDVTVQPLGLDVRTVEATLGFDPEARIAAREDGSPDCDPPAELPVDASSFAFLPPDCEPGESCTGVRAAVEASGRIPDRAVLFRCRVAFTGEPAQSCQHALACSDGSATTGTGDPLRVDCSSGSLEAAHRSAPLSFAFAVDPPEPVVGDSVHVTFTVRGEGGIPSYRLDGTAPILIGETTAQSTTLGEIGFDLRADCPGTAYLQLSVNYETTSGCPGVPVFYFRNETSPGFQVRVRDPNGYSVNGTVTLYAPYCGEAAADVAVRLEPLGRTTTSGSTGGFNFDGVPPGDYSVVIDTCTPAACWPPVSVHVVDDDVAVRLCSTLKCPGDCNHDGAVHIDDLVRAVGVALLTLPLEECQGLDVNLNFVVTVDELVGAVSEALDGCPG